MAGWAGTNQPTCCFPSLDGFMLSCFLIDDALTSMLTEAGSYYEIIKHWSLEIIFKNERIYLTKARSISIYRSRIDTLKVDTLEGLCEILFGWFGIFVTISTSSEDDDVTVTPFIVTDVGAPISRIGTQGVDTGAGPVLDCPLWPRAPTVASLVIFVPVLLLPEVNSCCCFFILIHINT